MKLSKKQQDVLDKMKNGAVAHLMKGRDCYWFLSNDFGHCTRTIETLLKLGLIEITKQDWKGAIAKYKRQDAPPA